MIAAFCHADVPLTSMSRLKADLKSRLRPALESSFHFRLEPGVDCTGTYISETGHFLTALHCVAGCLARHRAIRKERAFDEPTRQVEVINKSTGDVQTKNFFTYLMTVDEDRVDEGIECPIRIGEQKELAEVVLTGGRGWLSPKNSLAKFSEKFPDEYRNILASGYEHGYDFAILKTAGKTSGKELEKKGIKCLSLGQSAPINSEVLHAISFPCLNRDSISTTGLTPLYTSGSRTAGISSSELYMSQKGVLPFKSEFVDREDTFFSSLDVEKCGSGTAVLDNHSRIVGIATRVYKSSTEYEYGSVESVDISQVWRDLYDKKSGFEIKVITACKRKLAKTIVPVPKTRLDVGRRRITRPPASVVSKSRKGNA